jgi:hypothetical protein
LQNWGRFRRRPKGWRRSSSITDFVGGQDRLSEQYQEGPDREYVHWDIDVVELQQAFQADDEGSIPFTRSTKLAPENGHNMTVRLMSARPGAGRDRQAQ